MAAHRSPASISRRTRRTRSRPKETRMAPLDGIHHPTFATSDMDRPISFHGRVFGARARARPGGGGPQPRLRRGGPARGVAPLPGARRRAPGPPADVRAWPAGPLRAQSGQRGGVPGDPPSRASRGRGRRRGDRHGLDAALQLPRPGRWPTRGGLGQAGLWRAELSTVEIPYAPQEAKGRSPGDDPQRRSGASSSAQLYRPADGTLAQSPASLRRPRHRCR